MGLNNTINNFLKRHTKSLNVMNSNLIDLNERCEQMKFVGSCKKETFDELKHRLETKSEELDEVNGKLENLQSNFNNLHNALLTQSKKYADLEISYGDAHRSMEAQLKQDNEQMKSVQIMLDSKEAECAAYLKDMRAQLDNANQKNFDLERNVSELQTKVSELEKALETYKEEGAIEKENIAKKYEEEIQMNQKKFNKKKKRIAALEKKIATLENEKKDLQNTLELEGHKIRDLQRVLNRPINRASAFNEENEISKAPANPVEPLRNPNETSSSDSRPSSPAVQQEQQENRNENAPNSPRHQILKRRLTDSTDRDSGDLNNFLRNTLDEMERSGSVVTVVNKRPPSERNRSQAENAPVMGIANRVVRSQTILGTAEESSDEITFPAYELQANSSSIFHSHSSSEAKRARK